MTEIDRAAVVAAGTECQGGGGGNGAPGISVLRGPGENAGEQRQRVLNRYAGRLMQRRMLGLMGMRQHALATCGFSREPGRRFKVGGDGKARSTDVETCDGRLCQVCGPAASAQRAAETGAAVWRWLSGSAERSAVFVSLAPGHSAGDEIEELGTMLLDVRGEVMDAEDASWRALRKRLGIYDVAWTFEPNIGPNGPHPGLHFVLLLSREWDGRDVDRFDAWLWLGFRAALRARGFTAGWSASRAIDIRQVDDPVGLGKYLTKWGIGAELASGAGKIGRNGENVPYLAIPSILAAELGRRQLPAAMRRDARVRRLVGEWARFARWSLSDRHHWFKGFYHLTKLVPELRGVTKRAERIAICTDLLPEELRPSRHDDAEEADEDDGTGLRLEVDADSWAGAQRAWWGDRALLPRLMCAHYRASPAPLELAVCWLVEDHGIEAAAAELAELAGAVVVRDGPHRWRVELQDAPLGLVGPPRDLSGM